MGFLQGILNLDTDLFLYLNRFHSDFWDTIMLLITQKETWFPFFAIILYFFIKNYKSKSIVIILLLALTILASDQISVLIKEVVQRLRPTHEPAIESLVYNVLGKGGLYGFVSSHASNAFAILVFTSRIFKSKSYWSLLLLWAFIFSYSRIYIGVHYPFDIIGGGLLGWLIGWAFYKLLIVLENHFFLSRDPKIEETGIESQQVGIILLVFVVLLATMIIVSSLLHHYNYL